MGIWINDRRYAVQTEAELRALLAWLQRRAA